MFTQVASCVSYSAFARPPIVLGPPTFDEPMNLIQPLPPVASGPVRPRRIDRLFALYAADHRNPWNIAAHTIGIPLIVWSSLALISRIPFPTAVGSATGLDWSLLAAAGAIIYYLTLSRPLALAMAVVAAAAILLVRLYPADAPLRLSLFAAGLFFIGWAFQFAGHRIEGRRPAFFHDLQFLLIGPAWLIAFLFRALHLRY